MSKPILRNREGHCVDLNTLGSQYFITLHIQDPHLCDSAIFHLNTGAKAENNRRALLLKLLEDRDLLLLLPETPTQNEIRRVSAELRVLLECMRDEDYQPDPRDFRNLANRLVGVAIDVAKQKRKASNA